MAEDVENDWFDSPRDSSDEENEKDLQNIEENGEKNETKKTREAEGGECEEVEEDNVLDFSSEEMEVLVREVEKRHEALFGDYKEMESPKSRWLIWQEVAEAVNVISSTYRNLEQVRVKWFEYKNPNENVKRVVRKGIKRKNKQHTGMFMRRNKETFQVRSLSCLMRRKFEISHPPPPRRIPASLNASNSSNPETTSLDPLPEPPSRNLQAGLPVRQYPISNSVKKEKEIIVENIPVTDLEPIILKDGNTIMKVLPLSKKRILEIKMKDKEKEALETKKAEKSVDRWIDNIERELKLQKTKKLCEQDGQQQEKQPSQKENELHHAEGEEETGGTKKKEVVRTLADLEKLLLEGVRNSLEIGVPDVKTCQESPEERFKNASCASAVVPPDGDNDISAEVIPSTSTDSGGNSENGGSSTSPRVANNLISSVDISPLSLTAVSSAAASSSTAAVQKIEQGSSISAGSARHEKNSTNNEDANVKVQWEQLKIKHPVTGKTVLVTKVYPKGTKVIEDPDKKQYVLPRRDLLKANDLSFKQLIDTKQVSKASCQDDMQKLVIKEPMKVNEVMLKKVLPIKESTIMDTLNTQKNVCQISNKVSSEEIVVKDPTTGKEICLKKVIPIKRDLVAETGIALPVLCPSLPSSEIVVKNPITGKDIVVKKMILTKEALEEKSLLGGDSLKKMTGNTLSEGKTINVDKKQTSQSLVVQKQEKITAHSLTEKQSTKSISALNNSSSSTKLEVNNGLVADSSTNQIKNETSSWKMTEDADHPPTIKTVVSNKGILRMPSVVPSTYNQLVKSSASVAFSSPNSTLSTSVANLASNVASVLNEPKVESNAIPLVNIPKEFAKVTPNLESVSTPVVKTHVALQPANTKVPINVVKYPSSAVPVNIANQPSTIKSAVTVNNANNSSGVKTLIPVDIANHPSAVKNAKPINIILHPSSVSTSPTVSDDKNTVVKNIVALQPAELGSFLEFKNSENILINGGTTGNAETIGVDSRTEELAGKQVVIAKLQLPPTESSSNDVVVKDPITGKNITIKKLTMAKDNKLVTALLKRAMQKGTLVGEGNLPIGKLITKNEKVAEEIEVLDFGTNSVSKNNLPSINIIKEDNRENVQCSRNLFPMKQAVISYEKTAVQDSVKKAYVIPSTSSSKQINDFTLNSFLPGTTGNDVQTNEMPVMKEEIFEDLTSINASPQNEINYQDGILLEQHRREVRFEMAKTIKEEPDEECSLIHTREEKELDGTPTEVESNKMYHLAKVTDESLDREVFMLQMDSSGKFISKSVSQDVNAVKYEVTYQQPESELVASRENHGKAEQGHLSTKHGSPVMSIVSHHPSQVPNYIEDSRKFAGKQIREAKRSCELATVTSRNTKRPNSSMEWREKEKIVKCAPKNDEAVESMMEMIHTGADCAGKEQVSIHGSWKDTKGMDMPSLDIGTEVEVVEVEVVNSSSFPSRAKRRKTGEEQSLSRENEQLHPLVRAALVGEPLDFEAELNKTDGGVRGKEVRKGIEKIDRKCEEGEGRKAMIGNRRTEMNKSSKEEKGEVKTSKEKETLSLIKIADSRVGSSTEHQRKSDGVSVIDLVSQGPSRSRRKISPLENRSYQMFKQPKLKQEIVKEEVKLKTSVKEKDGVCQIYVHDISPSETLSVHPSPKCYTRSVPRRDPLGKGKS